MNLRERRWRPRLSGNKPLTALDRAFDGFADCALGRPPTDPRRPHERAFVAQVRVGVHFENKQGLVFLSQAKIDPSIVSEAHGAGDIERNAADFICGLSIDSRRATGRDQVIERRCGIPLGVVSENVRAPGRKLVKADLDDRKGRKVGRRGRNYRNAELAAGDKLFDEGGLAKLPAQELHALGEGSHIVHHRTVVDSDARVFRYGFDYEREPQVAHGKEILSLIDNGVGGGPDAVGGEDGFRQWLVQREAQRESGTAGVGDPMQFEERGHVHLERSASRERFTKVEDQLRTVGREKIAEMGGVGGAEDHRVMTCCGEAGPYEVQFADKFQLNRVVGAYFGGMSILVRASQPVMDDRNSHTTP